METLWTLLNSCSNPYCIGNLIEGRNVRLWLFRCIGCSNPYCIGNLIEENY